MINFDTYYLYQTMNHNLLLVNNGCKLIKLFEIREMFKKIL